MGRHPDLGDSEIGIIAQCSMGQNEREQKRRETEKAELEHWKPLGRWIINLVSTKAITGSFGGCQIVSGKYHLVTAGGAAQVF
ncbi:hypothetical protein LCGC14_0469420 [marine sediment metagenome]|uniref:Uncharacterized protein n=1 Tax=marine sediment metagenome TaxID=412755 RepID=A0A0F9SVC4_9ZZZZ